VRITDDEAEELDTLGDAVALLERKGSTGASRRSGSRGGCALVSVTPVAVTGLGLVTPAGIGVEASWQGVLSGVSAAAPDPNLDRAAGRLLVPRPRLRRGDAARPARPPGGSTASCSSPSSLRVRPSPTRRLDPESWDGARVGVVLGCGMGGAATWEAQHRRMLEHGP
jgi:hypothetical protein